MRSVVTGCSGFIGGHLVRALLDRGDTVLGVDIRKSEPLIAISEQRPSALSLVWADLRDPGVCEEIADGATTVYHLAAETDMGASVARPVESLGHDLVTTVNVLEACRRHSRWTRVLIASSAAVYGAMLAGEATEGWSEGAIMLSPYAVHKRTCEAYASLYMSVHGMHTVCPRLFNVYGPGQAARGAVVPAFILGILRGQTLTIRGDGKQARDFVHVSDVVRALIMLAKSHRTGVINVGTGVATTILDLVQAIEAETGIRAACQHLEASVWDVRHSCASIGAIQSMEWDPVMSLQDGLVDTVAYYRGLASPG